jgi:hypothetical protein
MRSIEMGALVGPEGHTTVLSLREPRTQERGGRTGGGCNGGGRGGVSFQDDDNARNISTAIVEYDADAPPATEEDDTITDRGGRNGRPWRLRTARHF